MTGPNFAAALNFAQFTLFPPEALCKTPVLMRFLQGKNSKACCLLVLEQATIFPKTFLLSPQSKQTFIFANLLLKTCYNICGPTFKAAAEEAIGKENRSLAIHTNSQVFFSNTRTWEKEGD